MVVDAAPILRSHQVKTLGDRVRLLKGLVWEGDLAFMRRRPQPDTRAYREAVRGSLLDPWMREKGLLITQNCPARNDLCELKAVFNAVAMNTRYTGDVAGRDTFQSAYRTMQFGGGDCDDHAVLTAVFAMENGFATKFRITSNTGATWDHIYTVAGVPKHAPKRWIPLDTTLGLGRFNRNPPQRKHKDFLVGGVG